MQSAYYPVFNWSKWDTYWSWELDQEMPESEAHFLMILYNCFLYVTQIPNNWTRPYTFRFMLNKQLVSILFLSSTKLDNFLIILWDTFWLYSPEKLSYFIKFIYIIRVQRSCLICKYSFYIYHSLREFSGYSPRKALVFLRLL